jgi:transposase-like protein
MDPQAQSCRNPACPARGLVRQGKLRVHSRKEQRWRCHTCGGTFVATKGTPFYRLRRATDLVVVVLTLRCHGCPVQAIVAAFGLDERTVAAWQARAGAHAQRVHEYLVEQGRVELGHVQADELWVKLVGRRVWRALAVAVPTRLWLGGAISPQRDQALIRRVVARVRARARPLAVRVCVDGFASYVTEFRRAFRVPVYTGRRGRPRRVLAAGFLLGQVVKRYAQRRVVSVSHRVREGTAAAITAVLEATGTGTQIHTAYVERLNATYRGRLAVLVRRGRALARTVETLTAGMWLVGSAYNFCWVHASLRRAAPAGAARKWEERTPAMAAGLTDHVWTLAEVLHYPGPQPPAAAPERRRRPRKLRRPPALLKAA